VFLKNLEINIIISNNNEITLAILNIHPKNNTKDVDIFTTIIKINNF